METSISDAAQCLKFCSTRLQSLLRTLRMPDLEVFHPLTLIADFVTLIATHEKGLKILFEPNDPRLPDVADPLLQLVCVDASLAMRPIFQKFHSVIITSGTLSPIDMYPKLLAFQPKCVESLDMSLSRECISPIIISKGDDSSDLTTMFDLRLQPSVILNYGKLLVDMAACIPDGMVCFFPSYSYMEEVITTWHDAHILSNVRKHKLVFVETKDVVETSLALDSYKQACDKGRGAVFLSVARGKVAEGIDFDRHFGRCVIMFGIPYQYSKSRPLHMRMTFLHEEFRILQKDFLAFDAMRQVAQCAGRIIRSKTDYGIMVFADRRYSKPSLHKKLPRWIHEKLKLGNGDMPVLSGVGVAKQFMKDMAQPYSKARLPWRWCF
jgi:DNA excision repair protein ERCC-2